MCLMQLSLLDWMNNLLISKVYFADVYKVFASQKESPPTPNSMLQNPPF